MQERSGELQVTASLLVEEAATKGAAQHVGLEGVVGDLSARNRLHNDVEVRLGLIPPIHADAIGMMHILCVYVRWRVREQMRACVSARACVRA